MDKELNVLNYDSYVQQLSSLTSNAGIIGVFLFIILVTIIIFQILNKNQQKQMFKMMKDIPKMTQEFTIIEGKILQAIASFKHAVISSNTEILGLSRYLRSTIQQQSLVLQDMVQHYNESEIEKNDLLKKSKNNIYKFAVQMMENIYKYYSDDMDTAEYDREYLKNDKKIFFMNQMSTIKRQLNQISDTGYEDFKLYLKDEFKHTANLEIYLNMVNDGDNPKTFDQYFKYSEEDDEK